MLHVDLSVWKTLLSRVSLYAHLSGEGIHLCDCASWAWTSRGNVLFLLHGNKTVVEASLNELICAPDWHNTGIGPRFENHASCNSEASLELSMLF